MTDIQLNENIDIFIPKKFFKGFENISDGSFQLYVLLLLESVFGSNNSIKKDIIKKLNIGDTTFHRNLKPLIEKRVVGNVSSYKKGKEKYTYGVLSKILEDNETFIIDSLFLNKMYEELKKEELKVYCYLHFFAEDGISKELGSFEKEIGKSKATIIRIVKKLVQKGYIQDIQDIQDNLNYLK